MARYIHVEEPKVIICYAGKADEFDIENIEAIYVTRKRIPYYGVIKFFLVGLLALLVFVFLCTNSFYLIAGLGPAYIFLCVLNNQKTYKLCIRTKTGIKMILPVKRCHKRQLIEEVYDFLEDYTFR